MTADPLKKLRVETEALKGHVECRKVECLELLLVIG